MAQTPPDQNFYHHPHTHSLPHAHPHPHQHSHSHSHPQLQLPPQFRNPFDLLFDDRTSAINYNYIRPYIPNQLHKPDDLSDSLVMRRPRRTRTTFTSAQIAELEQHFLQGRYLTSSRLAELSAKLALGTAQVKIWFKNRRRRHKIQSDQQKEHSSSSSFSCDGMPLSPSMAGIKSEGPPSLQALTLTCSGGGSGSGGGGSVSTPATLTPSPTPTTPTASLIDHYNESFNQFYYNNHHNLHIKGPPPPTSSNTHHNPQVHGQQYPPTSAAAAAAAATVPQYFPNAHTHHHSLQQEQQQQQQEQEQQQQQSQQTNQHHHHLTPQGQYNAGHHHYANNNNVGVGGASVVIKEDPDFNFNNPYYMRMSSLATPVAASVASANVGNVTVPPASGGTTLTVMSPNSEVYEPLTPKNDESPSLCNGVGGNSVELSDRMDESNTKSLQVLIPPPPKNIGRGVETCANINSIIGANESTMSLIEECTGAFSKYSKLASDIHETNYQCTMDTIMHAYNSHRNSSSNTQFSQYCFN